MHKKSVSVFLLPGLFVALWRGCFGLGSGSLPTGCSPVVPQRREQSRSGGSRQGQPTAQPAAGRRVPSKEVEAEDTTPVVKGSTGAWLGQAPRGTAEMKGSSGVKRGGTLRTRLPTWRFPTRLFSRQPKARPCSCATPELALSRGG